MDILKKVNHQLKVNNRIFLNLIVYSIIRFILISQFGVDGPQMANDKCLHSMTSLGETELDKERINISTELATIRKQFRDFPHEIKKETSVKIDGLYTLQSYVITIDVILCFNQNGNVSIAKFKYFLCLFNSVLFPIRG